MEADASHDYNSYPLTNPGHFQLQSTPPLNSANHPASSVDDPPLDPLLPTEDPLASYSQHEEYYENMYQFPDVAEPAQ